MGVADVCQFSMIVENCVLLGYYTGNLVELSSRLLCYGSVKSSIIFLYWQSDLKHPCSIVTVFESLSPHHCTCSGCG